MQRFTLGLVATLFAGAVFAQSAVVAERSINAGAANEAAIAAMEQCRKDGFRVTVTVVNRHGQIKAVVRDDGTGPHTVENSFRKAYTSATFRISTGEIAKRQSGTLGSVALLQLSNVTPGEGALPIRSNDEVIGAIGVSGAPGGDKDAVCAQVGIDRIKGGL
jgi:uncharacterized protein GlcG (DUF336 family)